MAARLLLGVEALALGAVQGGASFYASQVRPAAPECDRAVAGGLAIEQARDAAEAAAAVVDAAADGALGFAAVSGADLPAVLPHLSRASRTGAPALFAIVGMPGAPGEAEAGPEGAGQLELAALRACAVPVLVPASAGECFSLARAGARESRARRGPVVVYVDHVIGHLREPVDPGPDPDDAAEGDAEAVPAAELYRARDALALVVAAGIAARSARTAVRIARERGIRAGLFRPVRLWPLAEAALAEAASRARIAVVVELNEGQLWEPVAARLQALPGRPRVRLLAEPRGGRIAPERVLRALEEEEGA